MMTKKTPQEVVEANKRFFANHPELKTWKDVHALEIKNRLNASRGIKCLLCNERDESANTGGKFTCDTCRDFLIRHNHYFVSGESDTMLTESRDDYVVRMREVLDMPEIGTVRKAK